MPVVACLDKRGGRLYHFFSMSRSNAESMSAPNETKRRGRALDPTWRGWGDQVETPTPVFALVSKCQISSSACFPSPLPTCTVSPPTSCGEGGRRLHLAVAGVGPTSSGTLCAPWPPYEHFGRVAWAECTGSSPRIKQPSFSDPSHQTIAISLILVQIGALSG